MKNNIIDKILISTKKLNRLNKTLAKKIEKDYKDKEFIMVGLLKGCLPFLTDLSKLIKLDFEIHYMDVSSYKGLEKEREDILVNLDLDKDLDIKGKNILIVEDIIDSGNTLYTVKNMLEQRGANVKIVALLDKPYNRVKNITADYVGTRIPNLFVLGYGLDYLQKYRNLPYIGTINKKYIK